MKIVAIKGFEMPAKCVECKLRYTRGMPVCHHGRLVSMDMDASKRHPRCPLVEIEVPE